MELVLKEGYAQTSEGDMLPPLTLLAEDTGKYTEYKIWGTPIEGLLVWDRKRYNDIRGSVQELLKVDELSTVLGRELVIKQSMLSTNEHYGVFRGLHAEPMDKLVTPITGKVFIAIADIRPDSKTFGQYVSFIFDQTDHKKPRKTLVVSNGLANSFLTLTDEEVLYIYAATGSYKTSEGKKIR